MKLTHITGSTFCLTGKTAIGVYRFDGNKCILIDNGYSKEYDELISALRDSHLEPAALIVSHAHLDHHGNSKRLRKHFGIPLAMPLAEAALASSKAALDRYTNYFGRSREEQISIDRFQICQVDRLILPEETEISLCGISLRIYHLPGHSFDHIAVVTPDDVCFGGDILLTERVLRHVKLPYCDHVRLDLASKEKIASLPYRHWIFSHTGPVEGDIQELSEKNRALILQRLDELCELLTTPMTRDQFYQASRVFLDMHIGAADQLIRQERHLYPYLEDLVTTGRAAMEVRDKMIYYRKAQF